MPRAYGDAPAAVARTAYQPSATVGIRYDPSAADVVLVTTIAVSPGPIESIGVITNSTFAPATATYIPVSDVVLTPPHTRPCTPGMFEPTALSPCTVLSRCPPLSVRTVVSCLLPLLSVLVVRRLAVLRSP